MNVYEVRRSAREVYRGCADHVRFPAEENLSGSLQFVTRAEDGSEIVETFGPNDWVDFQRVTEP
jgi:hypothetical protein